MIGPQVLAALIPGRRNEKCHNRWARCLDIASMKVYEKGTWTMEEDAKLTGISTKAWHQTGRRIIDQSTKCFQLTNDMHGATAIL